jgi:ketosteroid isomerase-like protein
MAESTSQLDENKALVRRLFDALQAGDLATLNELGDPKGVTHGAAGTHENGGPHKDLKDACPMCVIMNPRQITVDFMVAEGDLVTVRSIMRATQSGQYHDMPPSGKQVTISYINVYRIRNHRIVENWVAVDRLSLMEQLGRKLCPPEAP